MRRWSHGRPSREVRQPLQEVPGFRRVWRRGGGAERDRTADLVNAIHALSQLSYGPLFLGRPACDRSPVRCLSIRRAAVAQARRGTPARGQLRRTRGAHAFRAQCCSSGSATGPPMMPDMSAPSSSSSSRKVSSSSPAAGSSSPSMAASPRRPRPPARPRAWRPRPGKGGLLGRLARLLLPPRAAAAAAIGGRDRKLVDGLADRADDRVAVEVVEAGAAFRVLARALGAAFGFRGHGTCPRDVKNLALLIATGASGLSKANRQLGNRIAAGIGHAASAPQIGIRRTSLTGRAPLLYDGAPAPIRRAARPAGRGRRPCRTHSSITAFLRCRSPALLGARARAGRQVDLAPGADARARWPPAARASPACWRARTCSTRPRRCRRWAAR